MSHLWKLCERRPHQRDLKYARPKPHSQRDTAEHGGGHNQRHAQDNHAGAVQSSDKKGPTTSSYARILGKEGVGIPRHTKAAQESVQRIAAAAPAAAAGVSADKHDGTNDDTKPDSTTLYGATDDDACVGTYEKDAAAANDAAAADYGANTADDGTTGTIVHNDTVTEIGWAVNAAVGPATALCWIPSVITHEEELLTFQGEPSGSFKQ